MRIENLEKGKEKVNEDKKEKLRKKEHKKWIKNDNTEKIRKRKWKRKKKRTIRKT